MKLPLLRELNSLEGKRVLVRASLNVPIDAGVVLSDFRLVRLFPTIEYLRERGARIIIIGHIGRDPKETLKPVCQYLSKKFEITFVKDSIGSYASDVVADMQNGDIVLLENLRQKDGEYTNDESFSKRLASLADIYVNEAFAVSHRKHASIVGVPMYLPSYAGLAFENEVENLFKALSPKESSLFILGGAKFATKEPLIRKFLDIYDRVFVGGALANDFFKARGLSVGKSLVAKADHHLKDIAEHPNLVLPRDVVVQNSDGYVIKKPNNIEKEDSILDAGPETVAEILSLLRESSFVLWNGPLGDYEKGFNEHTEQLAKGIVSSGIESIVGGGDTVAALSKLGLLDKLSFVSSAGGAMLSFLLDGTLPGIEALKNSKSRNL